MFTTIKYIIFSCTHAACVFLEIILLVNDIVVYVYLIPFDSFFFSSFLSFQRRRFNTFNFCSRVLYPKWIVNGSKHKLRGHPHDEINQLNKKDEQLNLAGYKWATTIVSCMRSSWIHFRIKEKREKNTR